MPVNGRGRPRAATNKRKLAFRERLKKYCEDKGVDPHFWMVDVLTKQRVTYDLKLQCAKELAQYLEPKLRAIELSGSAEHPLHITYTLEQRLQSAHAGLEKVRNGHAAPVPATPGALN